MNSLPWVEKYRPRVLSDVAFQDEAMKMLSQVAETCNMPHLLFHGPPGTGKTSAILALANELFGKEHRNERVKELNASDDRGITSIRDKVKTWSRLEPRALTHPQSGRPAPPWKIVILDEADMMTTDAQSALRRIIEEFSRSTRFVILCNYFHKIIDPLTSRCSVYRFNSISEEAQVSRLKMICTSENVRLENDQVLRTITSVTNGDLRRAVTLLQTVSGFHSVLDSKSILELAGVPDPSVAEDLIAACQTSTDKMESCVQTIHNGGWDTSVLCQQIVEKIVRGSYGDVAKARIALHIAERDFAVLQNANSYLNMLAVGRLMCQVLGAK